MSDSHCCCRALSKDGGLSAGIHSAECYFPSVRGEILWVRKHGGGSCIRAPLRTDLLTSLPSLAVRLLKHTSSFEDAATFLFPYFPAMACFLLPWMRLWGPQGHSLDLWLTGESPYGPRRSALTATHLECLDSQRRFFDVSILRDLKEFGWTDCPFWPKIEFYWPSIP